MVAIAEMRANSLTFLYNLKTTNFALKNATKAFLLENEGSVFCLETPDVDVTTGLVAQVLINLEKEAVLKENLNEILFTDFSSFTTMSLKQNQDFQKNFPDLLVCKLGKGKQLDKQSHIMKSWMNAVEFNCKKIIFIVENPKHLEKSMKDIRMANFFKIKLNKLWEENEITTNNEAICDVKNNEANLLDEQSVVNNNSARARASDEDTNVNVVEEEIGQTSLHSETTASNDNADLIKFLQSIDVEELEVVDRYGNTPLHLAARDGKTQIVEFILAYCVMPQARNIYGSTALHLAAKNGHSAIVHMLLEYGFSVNFLNNIRFTPLHNACFYNNDDHLIEILLKFGAGGIEITDKYGVTALHYASLCGHSVVVNSLLKHGAKINTQNLNGYSPLHFATLSNRQEIVLILLEQGADLKIKNKWQQNALDLARSKNFSNLIRIFENHK